VRRPTPDSEPPKTLETRRVARCSSMWAEFDCAQDVCIAVRGGHRAMTIHKAGTASVKRRSSHTAHQSLRCQPHAVRPGTETMHPVGTNRSGRFSAMQHELNNRIMAACDAESILKIVAAEHGVFHAANAATACNRLAKTRNSSSHAPRMDDRRVRNALRRLFDYLRTSTAKVSIFCGHWQLKSQVGGGLVECVGGGGSARRTRA